MMPCKGSTLSSMYSSTALRSASLSASTSPMQSQEANCPPQKGQRSFKQNKSCNPPGCAPQSACAFKIRQSRQLVLRFGMLFQPFEHGRKHSGRGPSYQCAFNPFPELLFVFVILKNICFDPFVKKALTFSAATLLAAFFACFLFWPVCETLKGAFFDADGKFTLVCIHGGGVQ